MKNLNIILASNSPRRKELLKYIFKNFKTSPSDIDERGIEKNILNKNFKNNLEKYLSVCNTLAYEKCKFVANNNFDSLIIGADTIVYDENKIFGKPKDEKEAIYMLEYLSGKKHIVQTSVCVFYKGEFYNFFKKTYVTFNELTNLQKEMIKDYVKNYNPFDKAGAYGIQDKGALLIKEIDGDFFNVVGLPISSLNIKINEILKK